MREMVGLLSLEAACATDLLGYLPSEHRDLIATQALPNAVRDGYWEGKVAICRFGDTCQSSTIFSPSATRTARAPISPPSPAT